MRQNVLFLCAIGLLAQACASDASSPRRSSPTVARATHVEAVAESPPLPAGRLPRDVMPQGYALWLTVDPAAARFSGRVRIAVKLAVPRQRVLLHGAGLSVKEAAAEVAGASRNARYTELNDEGLSALDFDAPLPAGDAVLTLRYDAPFDGSLKGLYRVEQEGQSYAFTQFEPYSARMAFPCFDEPSFKTPFDLVLTVPEAYTAVANTPIVAEEAVAGGRRRVRFKTSKPLPTYLVALAVGPFAVVEQKPLPETTVRDRIVPFRGIAPHGQGAQLAYALSRTPAMVQDLERYFEIPYPYAKLDVIAVPDFAAGAMENAGAITFRDYLLLLDQKTAPASQRRAFAYVMAHELSHQWFGNLVTMPWWDDLWLNEAFATWMGYAVVDRLWPEQHASLALLESAHHAMAEDSLMSARMIREPIESTHDISNAFDAITYSKGGSVLAMFEHYLGPQTFRKGVVKYLNAHRFANATADDLLTALSQEAGQDVAAPFNTFLTQTGVPLVTADVRCGGDHAEVVLRQRRYLPVGSGGSRERLWQVPVCLRYAGSGAAAAASATEEQCVLVTEPELTVPLAACPAWLMPNADARGYYLWSLPADDLAALKTRGFGQLTVREQISFAESLKAAFGSADVMAEQVLPLLQSFAASSERSLAVAPLSILRDLRAHVLPPALRPKFSAYARRLYKPAVERLGLRGRAGEDDEDALLRAEIMGFLALVVEDPQLRKALRPLGRKALSKAGAAQGVSADLLRVAAEVAMQDGDRALFDQAYKRLVETDDPLFRSILLGALASVLDERREQALALSVDPALRVNEVLRVLAGQFGAEETREAAWSFVVQHFDALQKRVSARQLGRLPFLTTGFCSRAHAERLKAFFQGRIEHLTGGPRALAEAVEALTLCEAKVNAQRASVTRFFSDEPG